MARRSWRNFDLLLLGALLVLAAYGVVLIYSATIDTLGLEDLVRRQTTFVIAGTVLLLLTASIDYRLLETAQHPFAVLTPVMLVLVSAGMAITWRVGQLPEGTTEPLTRLALEELLPVGVALALILAVFTADRLWLEKLDLTLAKLGLAALVIGAAGAVFFVLMRGGGAGASGEQGNLSEALTPYLWVTGLAVLYFVDCVTLRVTDILRNPIYVLMLSLLGLTFLIGQASGGSQRWLGAGTIQPSELAKILTIVVLAKFLSDHEERMDRFTTVLVSIAVTAVPMLMIYLQPDLGTSLTLVAIWILMMWTAKIRLRHLFVLAVAGAFMLPLAWFGLEDYMRERLMLFIDPASNPDAYFNVHQALVSIGSGGWTGKGLTHGTQSQLHFLRVRHTDFIFAVTAEELGFLGSVVLIGLAVFVLLRMLRVADRAKDTFGRLIAAGVAALLLFQSVVNIGMNLGLVPVTGIPLPFISYGGSSLLTLMVGVGLVESVAMRHKKLEFD